MPSQVKAISEQQNTGLDLIAVCKHCAIYSRVDTSHTVGDRERTLTVDSYIHTNTDRTCLVAHIICIHTQVASLHSGIITIISK